jgi:vancomycin resistance protein YoaR
MAELDSIPQKQNIEIATAKIDGDTYTQLNELNNRLQGLFLEFGQIHFRKKEIQEELIRMDDVLERGEDDFKMTNEKIRELVEELDEKFPQGRINMQDGTIQYQPGAPTRKQQAEQQRQAQMNPDGSSNAGSGMKVVKE